MRSGEISLVRMCDTAYAVEAFHLVERPDARLIRLEGWFVSSASVQAMNLVIPGAPGRTVDVPELHRPSEGLVETYGERARNARFRLEYRLEGAIEGLNEARLMVLLANADMNAIPVGPPILVREDAQGLPGSEPGSRLPMPAPPLPPPVSTLPEPVFVERDRALAGQFESLGDNCEFGIVQRRVGVERIGLLRLGGARDTAVLIEAVRNGFEGFATEDDMDVSIFGSEWIVSSRRYHWTFHTGIGIDRMTAHDIARAQATTLAFMARKLLEDLETGTKIFLRRVDEGDVTAGMLELWEAIAGHGPGALLWVTAAPPGSIHGRVEHITGRLFRAYHAHLADYSAADQPDVDAWLELLRTAEAVITTFREPEPVAISGAEATPWWPAADQLPPEPKAPVATTKGWLGRLLGR